MHKPPRRMHISTGRFPLSQRSPSRRRAFLGVFSITKSFGRHDKCQRPRISLQIKRCQPITPPIIRRKHREIPIFRPRSVCRDLRLQNTRKNARRHHPHMARTKTKARPKRPRTIFIQINYCPLWQRRARRAESKFPPGAFRRTQEALAARSAQRGLLACPRTRREGTCSPPGQVRRITRRCKPSCAYPQQHQTGCPSESRGASSSQDRSRCSQPGRSQSRRHRRPCCRSRRPGR